MGLVVGIGDAKPVAGGRDDAQVWALRRNLHLRAGRQRRELGGGGQLGVVGLQVQVHAARVGDKQRVAGLIGGVVARAVPGGCAGWEQTVFVGGGDPGQPGTGFGAVDGAGLDRKSVV